jgi:esterase/lipase
MTNIPEEKFITKRQLWERSDAHAAAYTTQLQEVYNQINAIKEIVAAEISGVVTKDKQEMEKNRMALQDQFQNTKKELEKLTNDSMTRFQQLLGTHVAKVDKKIGELVTLLEDKTDRKITDRLLSISQEAKTIYEAVRSYKEESDRQLTKYQTDTAGRITALSKQVTEVMKRFKMISKGLS